VCDLKKLKVKKILLPFLLTLFSGTGCSILGINTGELSLTKENLTVELAPVICFGEIGREKGNLYSPMGIDVDSHGNIFIADTGNNRIQVFRSDGTFMAEFGKTGSQAGEFFEPYSVDASSGLHVLVADSRNGRIQLFHNADRGEFFGYIGTVVQGSMTTGNEHFRPVVIDYLSSGELLCVDQDQAKVILFNSSFNPKLEIGGIGSGLIQFSKPASVTITSDRSIFISDSGNHRVYKFDYFGNLLMQIGNGILNEPWGVAVDDAGSIYVSDRQMNQVLTFNAQGSLLLKFGSSGSGSGQFQQPCALKIYKDILYVVDTGNSRIQGFRIHYRESVGN
jgi:DNA-binding beta-propeller fold protein YncE